ncbi:hypothetical protein [Streptomyces hygroscopicus]|uniref:hypothetical protein n=1 Tax=Streptomyces hygroscopicus TaxID=1912 RepID=UPI00131E4747
MGLVAERGSLGRRLSGSVQALAGGLVDSAGLTFSGGDEVDLAFVTASRGSVAELDHQAPFGLWIDVDLVTAGETTDEGRAAFVAVDEVLEFEQG